MRRVTTSMLRSSVPGSRIANSSPPRRVTVSRSVSDRSIRRPTCCSRTSPTRWPSVLLISLNPSRSMITNANGLSSRCALLSSSWRRSRNEARFGRLVSTSQLASCCTSAAIRRCSRRNAASPSPRSIARTSRRRSPFMMQSRLPDGLGELGEIDRLADVAVGAEAVAAHDVLFFIGRGQHDDRHEPGAIVGPQSSQHLETVELRQFQIQQDDEWRLWIARGVRPSAEEIVEHLHAIPDDDDVIGKPVLLQRAHGERLVIGVVFDQQDRLAHLGTSEREVKRGALTRRSGRGHRAPMPRHDTLNRGQADAGAGELRSSMERLERGEKLLSISGIEPHAVIAYEKSAAVILPAQAELDSATRPPDRRLPGIAEQILEDDAEQTRVTVSGHLRLNDELDVPRRVLPEEIVRDGAGEPAQIDHFAVQFRATEG